MQDNATVFHSELEAVYQTFKYMYGNHDTLEPNYVKVLTDSPSCTTGTRQYRL